ncbi:restriction endonuclease subunit S [Enterococcus faecalis]|uniref:restriction endonuclease subunit S n=1 Tax=Enterococcus faecalis TaxID=1351 RepID=UPI003CC63A12
MNRIKLKYFCEVRDGTHDTPMYVDESEHSYHFVTSKDIKNGEINFNKTKFISESDYNLFQKRSNVEKFDVLMPMIGTVGNPVVVLTDIKFSIKNLALFKTNGNFLKASYLSYVLDSQLLKEQLSKQIRGGVQNFVSLSILNNIEIPISENIDLIVQFLNFKLNKIDSLINSKERQIKLLEEQRQAMITEAVTKGLNPNVKMKDSGVDWIGEIPEHWDVTKIKYTTYVKGRIGWQGLRSDEFIDEGPSLVTGTDFKNGKIDWQTCYHVSEERYKEAVPIQLQEDDLLITKDGTIGKLALVKEMPERAILNSGIFVTRPLMNQYINNYLYWNLASASFSQYIRTMETGSTIKHLYQETFVNYNYALPPKDEQESISYYLNNETQKLETIKQSMLNQISKLKEYRQSLIHEAVTGKIPMEEMETYLKEVEKNGG